MSNPNEIMNVDEWINSLYKEDNEFQIEYRGKTLSFMKRFATAIAFQMKDKPEEEQVFTLIAMLSKNPKFTLEQARKLPQDLVALIASEIQIEIPKKIMPKRS